MLLLGGHAWRRCVGPGANRPHSTTRRMARLAEERCNVIRTDVTSSIFNSLRKNVVQTVLTKVLVTVDRRAPERVCSHGDAMQYPQRYLDAIWLALGVSAEDFLDELGARWTKKKEDRHEYALRGGEGVLAKAVLYYHKSLQLALRGVLFQHAGVHKVIFTIYRRDVNDGGSGVGAANEPSLVPHAAAGASGAHHAVGIAPELVVASFSDRLERLEQAVDERLTRIERRLDALEARLPAMLSSPPDIFHFDFDAPNPL